MNRFERVFISLANCIDISFGVGLKFAAVDAAFSKHSVYRDGFLHLLTTRDGNNKLLILAVAICETESASTYEWFAANCKAAGIGRYLNKDAVIFSDRQKGIEAFHDAFRAFVGRCFMHIVRNCRAHIRGSGETFEDEVAWLLQKAKTEAEYNVHLTTLRAQSPMAAEYFDNIAHPEQVFQYLFNQRNVPTHGHKTSNIVESTNGVFVTARHYTPYRMLNKIIGWQGKEFYSRQEQLKHWIDKGHFLTQYAHNLFCIQVEIAKRTSYSVTPAGANTFYVRNTDRPEATQYEVNLDKPACCDYWGEHLQPCRHLVCVFAKLSMLGPSVRRARQTMESYWPKWAHAEKVQELYANRGIRQPGVYSGKFRGPDTERIEPPLQSAVRRGRPRKERFRYKPKTVDDVKARLPVIHNPDYADLVLHC